MFWIPVDNQPHVFPLYRVLNFSDASLNSLILAFTDYSDPFLPGGTSEVPILKILLQLRYPRWHMHSVFEHRLIGNGVSLSLQDFCKRFGWVPCKQETGSQCKCSDGIRWQGQDHRLFHTFMAMPTNQSSLRERKKREQASFLGVFGDGRVFGAWT